MGIELCLKAEEPQSEPLPALQGKLAFSLAAAANGPTVPVPQERYFMKMK